jgi:Icc protein
MADSPNQSSRRVTHLGASGAPLRVLQLTDTHLCRDVGGKLLGMDTDHSLQAVIDLVQRERPGVDLLLGTGDLSDNGCLDAYRRLEGYFDQLACPYFWLPGNHDSRPEMEAAASDPDRLCGELRTPHWQVVLLNSQIPGEVGGRLGPAELARLEDALAAAAREGLASLVCLHHQPVAVGSDWIDEQMIEDADEFWRVIDGHDNVKAVLWGHVHQECDRMRNGVRLLASPSTCVQFAPGNASFKADDQPPGYRWLELHPDGRLETAISRVWDIEFDVDLDSRGY